MDSSETTNQSQHGDHAVSNEILLQQISTGQRLMMEQLQQISMRVDVVEKNQHKNNVNSEDEKNSQFNSTDLLSFSSKLTSNAMSIILEKMCLNSNLKVSNDIRTVDNNDIFLNNYEWENVIRTIFHKDEWSVLVGFKNIKTIFHFFIRDNDETEQFKIRFESPYKYRQYRFSLNNNRSDEFVITLVKRLVQITKKHEPNSLIGKDGKFLTIMNTVLGIIDEFEVESTFEKIRKKYCNSNIDKMSKNPITEKTSNDNIIVGNIHPPERMINESFLKWIQRLEMFLNTNRIPEELRYNVLWNALNEGDRAKIKTEELISEKKLKNFNEIANFLSKKSMKRNPIEEFHDAEKNIDESVSMFYSRLEAIANITN
ncbi:hypothetical protein SNEBB_003551 [Seison nebaliae]|nr:hypothetical protein SNEBB_003551 [Seison nebaliae]